MLLLVGLGNPDPKYQGNRHNIGFQALDEIATCYNFPPAKVKFQGRLREGMLEGHGQRAKVLLLQPTTYYNDSGRAVHEAARFYKIPLDNIIVFHDELDLAPGKIKIKNGGGAAGNNGLKSITAHLGDGFRRVRLGIGHPGDKAKVTNYVLGDFAKSERAAWVDPLLAACTDAAPLLAGPKDEAGPKFLSRIGLLLKPPAKSTSQAPRASEKTTPNTTTQYPTSKSQTPLAESSLKGPFAALRGIFQQKD